MDLIFSGNFLSGGDCFLLRPGEIMMLNENMLTKRNIKLFNTKLDRLNLEVADLEAKEEYYNAEIQRADDNIPSCLERFAPETSSPTVEGDLAITERLGAFLRFLLSLDDYTLGILAAVIQGQNDRLSVAQLARIRHISRQGMHRKTLDAARKSPELAQLLKCVVLKIRKAKGDFTKKPGPKTESRQMTFDF